MKKSVDYILCKQEQGELVKAIFTFENRTTKCNMGLRYYSLNVILKKDQY